MTRNRKCAPVISEEKAQEWHRVSRLDQLSSVEAAVFLRISLTAFYTGPAKRIPSIHPAGPRSNAFYLMSDLVAYRNSTRETPGDPATT